MFFFFNQLMLTLIFAIRASEPHFGPGKRLKRPSLIGLISRCFKLKRHTILVQSDLSSYQNSRYFSNRFGSLISWIYTTIVWHDVIFLTWCYFFTPFSVNPIFAQDGVKKMTLLFFCIVLCKTMQTFDIMLRKIRCPSVNRFYGDTFLVRYNYWSQSGDDTTELWSDNWSQLQSWHETIYSRGGGGTSIFGVRGWLGPKFCLWSSWWSPKLFLQK